MKQNSKFNIFSLSSISSLQFHKISENIHRYTINYCSIFNERFK